VKELELRWRAAEARPRKLRGAVYVGELPARNLTFNFKFAAGNLFLKFEKFCQIFRESHETSPGFPHQSARNNLKKYENSAIIYIESERDNKVNKRLSA